MAVAFVGGAALGAVFGELLKVVVEQAMRIAGFRTQLKRLETTLIDIQPEFFKIMELRKVLNRPEEEMLTRYLKDAIELVRKCSGVKSWNAYHKSVYAKKLISLDNQLVRFFQIKTQADIASTGMESLMEILVMQEKLDQLLAAGKRELSGWCSVPGRPELIVGLDAHLAEVKSRLLKDETRVLVVSAPGGCGKTTLAKMLCHNDDIKDIFGENIFYVTVSRDSSQKDIAKKLFKHCGLNDFVFQTEEEANNQIENLLKQMGSDNILLVLDDVWPESESIVEDLKFRIPGFKILVTSRFSFQSFSSTYEMSLLNDEDSKTLFCYSAFPNDGLVNVPHDLVNKMVKYCKGLPLTLTVVGASLRGQPLVRWKATLKKWSEGQSILQSYKQLLLYHQTSIDALNELPNNVKECFLDLGSFPEDDRIAGTALMDMWVELYNLDDEGTYASENLFELSMRNLINLLPIRKDAFEIEGHCSEHFVTQHDLLRDLAIHLSSQEPVAERERLFTKIHKNVFPTWWTRHIGQPINARVLSISTDEAFSSSWYDLYAPNVEVLILNISSNSYSLPKFIEKMSKLKVLIITGYGIYPTQLDNLPSLGCLSNLKKIRFKHVSVSSSIQVIFTLQSLKKLTSVNCEIDDVLNCGSTKFPYMIPSLTDSIIDNSEIGYLQKRGTTEFPHMIPSLKYPENQEIGNVLNSGTTEFPSMLQNLRDPEINNCDTCNVLESGTTEFPHTPQNITYLEIDNCEIGNVTTEFPYMLQNLRDLEIDFWYDLNEVPAGPPRDHFQTLMKTTCQELNALRPWLGNPSNLEVLRYRFCVKLKNIP